MKFEFTQLSPAVAAAFNSYQKKTDIVNRKCNLLDSVLKEHKIKPDSILFLGFDPWILCDYEDTEIYVSMITSEVAAFLENEGVEFTRVYEDELYDTIPYDVVVAGDEFITYANNNQRDIINLVAELTNELFVTTLRDYKNINSYSKDFSQPTVIKNDLSFSVFQEFHNYKYKVKDRWTSYVYENGAVSNTYGPFNRQPMFFKQLAKFSYDAGATDFVVHGDLMFKSLLKKNYEHMISILFK